MKARNFTNPSRRTIKRRAHLLAKALRENPRKARGQMRKGGGRCCLQVAEDVAIACGLKIERSSAVESAPPPKRLQIFSVGMIKTQSYNIVGWNSVRHR